MTSHAGGHGDYSGGAPREGSDARLHFTLYIAGTSTVRSLAAKRRLQRLMSTLEAEVSVDVVDVLDEPARAESKSIYATPTLVLDLPTRSRRVVGDLADLGSVASGLGLEPLLRSVSAFASDLADADADGPS